MSVEFIVRPVFTAYLTIGEETGLKRDYFIGIAGYRSRPIVITPVTVFAGLLMNLSGFCVYEEYDPVVAVTQRNTRIPRLEITVHRLI